MTLASEPVVEILETSDAAAPVSMASPASLYAKWEAGAWSASAMTFDRDRDRWRAIPEFVRGQLAVVLDQLLTGETCVTHTLTPLIDHAPTDDMRIYLVTQLADEARHVRFFERYAETVLAPAGVDLTGDDAYGEAFATLLEARTSAVRTAGGTLEAWAAGLAPYQLVTEGILASTALRSTLQTVRRGELLPDLADGMTLVARDESRHVQFGIGAAQFLVDRGAGDAVFGSFLTALPAATRVLVDPMRHIDLPDSPALRAFTLRLRADQLIFARKKMRRVLTAAGGAHLIDDACRTWDDALATQLAAYEERFDTAYPIDLTTLTGGTRV